METDDIQSVPPSHLCAALKWQNIMPSNGFLQRCRRQNCGLGLKSTREIFDRGLTNKILVLTLGHGLS